MNPFSRLTRRLQVSTCALLAGWFIICCTAAFAQPPRKPPFKPPSGPPKLPGLPKLPTELKSLFTGTAEERFEALERLREKGPLPPEALSRLIDDENPLLRLQSLSSMDSESSPEMIKKLRQRLQQSDSPLEKILAASAMLRGTDEETQSGADEALAALDQALNSGDAAQANEAANALRRIGDRATPVLVKALGSNDVGVRRLATDALRQIGPDASDATPALLSTVGSDPDARVRVLAADAVASVTKDPQKSAEVLAQSLAAAELETAVAITGSLASIGQPAVAPLIQSLSNPRSRYWSVLALSEIGEDASSAEEPLANLLADSTPDIATEVLIALPKIGASKPETVSKVAQLLQKTDRDLRYAATFAIARMGVRSDQAESALQQNMQSDDLFLKTLSAWAIAKTNPRDPRKGIALMKTLGEMAQQKDPRVKEIAQLMLSDLSSRAPRLRK